MKMQSDLISRILLTIMAILVLGGIGLGMFVLVRNIIHEITK